MSRGILFLLSRVRHLHDCIHLGIILMVTLPYPSLDIFVSHCYFWPPGFISFACGGFHFCLCVILSPMCAIDGRILTYLYGWDCGFNPAEVMDVSLLRVSYVVR
jgi:hypothetical protein